MCKGTAGRGLAMTIIGALFVVAPLAGIAAAGEAGGSGDTEVLATLKVTADNVSVQKAGKNAFRPAKDGQKLKQGDTVKTDATGKAEIDYSDDAYTRLDVNTTFTITKLTEEQGERQIEGSLEEGRTWNRTAAITESGSFEQSGGGATAAVTGTAFPVDCTIAAPDCLFTGVEGTYVLKGNGEEQTITPFQQCGSTDGDLCDEVRTLTVDEMAAITWIQENLLKDLVERGLGPGPFQTSGVLVVENGEVVSFTPTTPPAGPLGPPPPQNGPDDPTVPPVIDPDNPIVIVNEDTGEVSSAALGPADEIVVPESGSVTFVVNISTDPTGLFVVFTSLPDDVGNTCENVSQMCNNVHEGTQYPVETEFTFSAESVSETTESTTGYVFYVETEDHEVQSEVAQVPVTVTEVSPCGLEAGASDVDVNC
jgi:hypothetical protein